MPAGPRSPRRRQVIRKAVLMAIGMALGKMDAVKATAGPGGTLTVPLDQWGQVVFTLKGKRIVVPVEEVFDALAEGRTT